MTCVLVRKWDMTGGVFRRIMSNFFGPKLYEEGQVYKNAKAAQALKMMFPHTTPELPPFKNPVLSVCATAIWRCQSAAEVCTTLNEAVANSENFDKEALAAAVIHMAFEEAKYTTPTNANVRTFNVIFNDGKNQKTPFVPDEIDGWVIQCNADAAKNGKAYRIVRVVDESGKVVWGM